jgi:hypothetical protein
VPGVARREVFLERWTAHGVAAAINADPEALDEIAPRLNPNGRIEADDFVFTDSAQRCPLDQETVRLLQSIDGQRPGFSLGVDVEELQALVQKKMIRWELEVPALEAHAFDQLLSDISGWRDNQVRARWLAQLQPLRLLTGKFAKTLESTARLALVKAVEERLENLGVQKTANRFLYSATNPIGEECFRQPNFVINEDLINQVTTDAEPWIDLWRDNYAFVASRVAAGLRRILEQAPIHNGALPLPEFLRRWKVQEWWRSLILPFAKSELRLPKNCLIAPIFQSLSSLPRIAISLGITFPIQSLTNALIRRPICSSPPRRLRRFEGANTNGSWPNCTRRLRCSIMDSIGLARIRPVSARRLKRLSLESLIFITAISRRISPPPPRFDWTPSPSRRNSSLRSVQSGTGRHFHPPRPRSFLIKSAMSG